ncbi:hypothetical protein [Paenarthrobacter sp. AMU7]|uniref:Uncharacterized protein n=1 Tax=Paenarthrobacter sp. AMU7 TaxID=3162492 RepID=A0AB39YN52_9MICC
MANIDIQRNDQVRAIKPIPAEHEQYYTVLGCAEGWVAYSISDDGIRAIGLDGGNAWYNVGKLQANGRYLTDFGKLWASIYNWESLGYAVQNGQFATVQQGMDKEFADKGIPVRLRTQLVGAGPAAGSCTVANIDIQRNDQVRAIKPIPAEHEQYYTVLGCAEGWVAYSISDDGIRAIGLDGGNAWYNVGKLQANGRYLTEFGQLWASIYNWESLGYAVQNGQFATVQQGMDKEFADKGIPVRLRTQLVGAGPTAPTWSGTP